MLFSVIVPVYGVAEYLPRCIESVILQTWRDFELILVDDGSVDGCAEICDEYAARDSRIRVLHKENGGLVSARQAGIKIASGDYIVNLDGDDFLCPDMLSAASEIISKTGVDIVDFSIYRHVDGADTVEHDIFGEGFYDRDRIVKEAIPLALMSDDMRHGFYYVWGKAIRRELALQSQLAVPTEISFGEDVSCTVPNLLRAKSMYVSRRPVYGYRYRPDSDSRSFKREMLDQTVRCVDFLADECGDTIGDQIDRYALFAYFVILVGAVDAKRFRDVGMMKKYLRIPAYSMHISRAKFSNITVKSKIALRLIKMGAVGCAYVFLKFCRMLKKPEKR